MNFFKTKVYFLKKSQTKHSNIIYIIIFFSFPSNFCSSPNKPSNFFLLSTPYIFLTLNNKKKGGWVFLKKINKEWGDFFLIFLVAFL